MEQEGKKRISKKVYDKIQSEDVKMKPSYVFVLRSWVWLGISGFLFLLATVSVSFDAYYLDAMESSQLMIQKPFLLLSALPYSLFLITIFVIFLAAMAYRKSRSCCRHENWVLLGILIFGALLIGISAHFAHLQSKMRLAMEKKVFFDEMVVTPREFWFQPEKGTMSGMIVSTDSERKVMLKAWDGSRWKVTTTDDESLFFVNKKGNCTRMIKMTGTKEGERHFEARTVWGW
ncbi:MAG: hypothetical protein U9O20_00755 [Patescibacteria group bacterium]|nr:hypothetical protein [Patescibacteria group bacterium]